MYVRRRRRLVLFPHQRPSAPAIPRPCHTHPGFSVELKMAVRGIGRFRMVQARRDGANLRSLPWQGRRNPRSTSVSGQKYPCIRGGIQRDSLRDGESCADIGKGGTFGRWPIQPLAAMSNCNATVRCNIEVTVALIRVGIDPDPSRSLRQVMILFPCEAIILRKEQGRFAFLDTPCNESVGISRIDRQCDDRSHGI